MGCFNMPKGQHKYKGTQKVEIIERMRREQMSFTKHRDHMKSPDAPFKTGNESIWKREKRLFWKNGVAEPVQPVERRKVESQSWIRKRKKTLLQRISVCAWRTTT